MTVEPGFGGQSFMNDMMKKVSFIRNIISEKSLNVDIQVDGGINPETIKIADESGANIFVLGTAFFKSESPVRLECLLGE
jgi:ribulose-phosphate 3-epimerase